MNISLIGVPIMYGCDRQGVQHGPTKLREGNIVDIIKKHKDKIYDLGDIHVPMVSQANKYKTHSKIKFLEEIIQVNTNLAHSVYSALRGESFPFIIGGDHSVGIGSISGASKHFKELAVIWVDAHGDINTPDSSPSGNFHGMPLAAAMGIGHPSTSDIYFQGQKVKAENVYIFGARDLDEGEVKLAKELNLNLYTMDKVREKGLDSSIDEVLDKIKASSADGVHLSFDIDVLDASLVPGTGTPVAEGFDMEEGKKLLKDFLSSGLVNSMDFVELNPYLDEDEITIKNCLELIDWIFQVLK